MTVQTKDFDTLVADQAAAIQGRSGVGVDLTIGSVFRALIEAFAALALWLQGLMLQILSIGRASTSQGADLDSWMADFAFARLAAVAATGNVTFARFTATSQALVPVGAQVQTSDGTQTFAVIADTSNPAYNAGQNGYVIPANTASIAARVQAVVAGTGGNVSAGTITVLTQAIPFVDTVNNASSFGSGENAETDAAFRARFVLHLAGLSQATKDAIGAAILSVEPGLFYAITENQDYAGDEQLGYFYVIVDDGSGEPSPELLAEIAAAIDAARPITVTFGLFAPVIVTANVSMTITTASGFVHGTVATAVQTTLASFINAQPVGGDLAYTQLAAIAYGVTGVTNVTAVLLNGSSSDLAISPKQVAKAGTITVT